MRTSMRKKLTTIGLPLKANGTISRGAAKLRNTCVNGIQVGNTKIFESLDILKKNTESEGEMSQSLEHVTATRNFLSSSLEHSVLFDRNLGIVASCQQIGKKVRRSLRCNTC